MRLRYVSVVLSTLAIAITGAARAETPRDKQHQTYKIDRQLMAREHQIELERKSGKLTSEEAKKEIKEAQAKASEERAKP